MVTDTSADESFSTVYGDEDRNDNFMPPVVRTESMLLHTQMILLPQEGNCFCRCALASSLRFLQCLHVSTPRVFIGRLTK